MVESGSILVTPRSFRSINGEHWKKLDASPYEVVRSPYENQLMSEEEMVEYVTTREVKGIIIGLDPVTREVIESAPELSVVSKYGTGLDNIDLESARKAGITVTYTPGTNDQSVADLTFGLLLGLARRIPLHQRFLSQGQIKRETGVEIWEKKLGIVGLGRIGTAVARRACGFNMEVLYSDIERQPLQENALDLEYRVFEDLLSESDIVTIHCPLTKETLNLIDEDEFKLMQTEGLLINTARHELINTSALKEALTEGEIAGAAMDTFDDKDNLDEELVEMENFVASPHAGASTVESVLRMANMATDQCLTVLEGKKPDYPVQ